MRQALRHRGARADIGGIEETECQFSIVTLLVDRVAGFCT
jgi:hypothetical protein